MSSSTSTHEVDPFRAVAEGARQQVYCDLAETGPTVHYNESEFWKHYNGPAYQALKKRYDPHGRQPDLYSKVTG
jgi:hypothetical protein